VNLTNTLTSLLGSGTIEASNIDPSVNLPVAASGIFSFMWLLLALPLLGAALLLLLGKRADKWGPIFAVLMIVGAFVVGCFLYFAMLAESANDRPVNLHIWDWVIVGNFQAPLGMQLDQLSMVFVLLITGVGGLIHIYSLGYMKNDPDKRKFFGYLNFFIAAMLLLVTADSYLLLYVGWEGVGLASYLLVGFWQYKPAAAVAAKKAFIMNRVGDVGLSIAIMMMFVTFGSVTFPGVLEAAPGASESTATWIGFALLLAACGKSAQLPLQAWLLDAMEGPTPVSALIHAATMVTAGVYLIVRSGPIFDNAPAARDAVMIVGAATLIFGAIIGSAKDGIKDVLAGSTMSQVGYMILAAGLGPIGYVFAIFHLLTHGMFKANLFLGAGSIMHSMHDQLDMRRFGALRKVMFFTFITFSSGWLAIMGVPPFSAFYSKDKIIEASFSVNFWAGAAALVGAGITSFYMTRLWTMTFTGKARWTENNQHPHESPKIMLIPMGIMGILSLIAGFVLAGAIETWLAPVTGFEKGELPISNLLLESISLTFVLVGGAIAYLQYRRGVPITPPQHVSALTVAARDELYGDAFNEAVFMRPGQWLTRSLVFVDSRAIDGMVNGTAAAVGGLSGRMRRLQTGFARSYALSMLAGAVLLIIAMILVRM
jgi:NADH-quinone oxidoreductase subunit L